MRPVLILPATSLREPRVVFNPDFQKHFLHRARIASNDHSGTAVAVYECTRRPFLERLQEHSPLRDRKEPDMELVMGGLLVGVSGMLAVLIVAVWKDSASHRAETHPPQRRM